MKFTKQTLDKMLNQIIVEYFDEDNTEGLWENIEYVKGLYSDEIDTLEEGEEEYENMGND